MELVFQENHLEYLSRILCETVTQEQTAELIVPDSCDDADRVVDAFGTVLVRTEECSAGSAAVSGQVQAGVLFVTAGGEVERLETQIPFSLRRDFPGDREDCTMQCACSLRSVDARMLNSRKLLLRVGVVCTLTVYAREERTVHDLTDPAPNLQLKRTRLPLKMPLALGEKSFVLNEELELPQSKPAIARLLKCVYRTEVPEQKLIGNKAVFKGNLVIHTLYEATDGSLQVFESALPFSQYAEMEEELDDKTLQTILTLTSAETEPDGQMACQRLLLSVNLLAQCVALGEREVAFVEDAFCTDATLEPQWEDWELRGILDTQSFRETARASADTPAGSIVDAWMYPDEAARQRQGTKLQVQQPLSCNVLYQDPEGNLQGRTLRPSVELETELAENGVCRVTEVSPGELFCAANGAGMEVRCPVTVTMESSALHPLRAVCGGTIEAGERETGRRPAVILRRTARDEEVWEVAKACRTTPQAVMEANGLDTPVIPAGTMLLIPI